MRILQVGALLCVLLLADARRVRVRTRPIAEAQDQEEQPQQVYYAEEQAAGADQYNGLYGQAVERADERYERPLARQTVTAQPLRAARVKDTPREPPVETIRNYSNINDDGSFTFGYESADGSFKEETRGTDCVVRGKYGYVDPDGNKREFTYVSGNPCDPNAPNADEEEKEAADDSGEENVPQNLPRPIARPLRPRPQPARPTTTVFQNAYAAGAASEEDDSEQQVYVQPTPARVRPQPRPQPPLVRVTPRPASPATLPPTTFRPQLLVSVTPRPNVVLTKHTTAGRPLPAAPGSSLSFDEELKRFQLQTTPRPATASPTTPLKAATPTGQPLYTSELVYDPNSGQYNTVVYQQVPKSAGDFSIKTRLPQYVPSPTPQYVTPAPPAPQPQTSSHLQQQLFQQQKQNLFTQSADLYNQQRLQQIQTQHRFQPSPLAPANTKPLGTGPQKFGGLEPQRPLSLPQYQTPEAARPAQQFYYFAPQQDVRGQGYSTGQIDSFLRNHNLQF